jgi:4-carboxymuconolactone decarboxylase
MTRIPLIRDRSGLDAATSDTFDWIVESRGGMLRPFEILLHVPALAQPIAELGHVVRYGSGLDDADRELAILATGKAHGCAFVWDSHVEVARTAGVSEGAISALAVGEDPPPGRERSLVAFVRALVASSAVDDETYRAAAELLGAAGVIELAATTGYYTILSYAMSVADAC